MAEMERPHGLPGPRQARRIEDFNALYADGTPAWDIGGPQPAFRELADLGRLAGRVLDVGCGTGEHALMAAAIGLDAAGIAIAIAKRKADERALTFQFMTWNALNLADLGQSFDTVLDCGLFHVFEDSGRPKFVEGLRTSMRASARYYMPPRARGVTVIAPKHGADRRALAWICTAPSEVGRCSACDDLPCAVVTCSSIGGSGRP